MVNGFLFPGRLDGVPPSNEKRVLSVEVKGQVGMCYIRMGTPQPSFFGGVITNITSYL